MVIFHGISLSMIGFVFALLSAFSFGISNVYWKTAHKQNAFARIVFYRGIITTSCFGLAWLALRWFPTQQASLVQVSATTGQYLQTVALCFVCSLGLIFYLLSLHYAPVSISVPLSSVNIFGITTAVVVLGEAFKTVYAFAFVLVIVGVCLAQSFRPGKEKLQWNRGATYAILAAMFWGTTYALFKYPVGWLGAVPLSFTLEACVTSSAFVWMLVTKTPVRHATSGAAAIAFRHYGVLAALLLCGTLFYNLAIQRVPMLLLNITGYFTTITSVTLGVLLYKEKLKADQVVGILCLVASIVIVQVWG